ncbi:MAG: heme o synthase [Planctomycetota bacterium]
MSTGLTTLPATSTRPGLLARWADFVELTKPRIVVLELVAVVVAMQVAGGGALATVLITPSLLLSVVLGTALVAGSANAMNMWLERELDAKMPRTADRPLPAGRLSPADAFAFALLTLTLGVTTLAMRAGWLPAAIALGTWAVYVGLYTPLKVRSWTNTAVGAVSGATPLWIGWTAGGGSLSDPIALTIVAVMYVWQFPHFMAIAWLSRHGYAQAGYKMSTVLDPTGWWAGTQAFVGSAVLAPISLAPLLLSPSIDALWYGLPVAAVGVLLCVASRRFFLDRSDVAARSLLRVSLVYVPVWLFALWVSGV